MPSGLRNIAVSEMINSKLVGGMSNTPIELKAVTSPYQWFILHEAEQGYSRQALEDKIARAPAF